MPKCKKCGRETKIVCICGHCPKCNGMEERMDYRMVTFGKVEEDEI